MEDGPGAHYLKNREEYVVKRRTVTAGDVIHAKLAPGGGHCVFDSGGVRRGRCAPWPVEILKVSVIDFVASS